jgi:hypothetical protein
VFRYGLERSLTVDMDMDMDEGAQRPWQVFFAPEDGAVFLMSLGAGAAGGRTAATPRPSACARPPWSSRAAAVMAMMVFKVRAVGAGELLALQTVSLKARINPVQVPAAGAAATTVAAASTPK